jgi:DNA-binding ferritin-like protein
MSIWDDPMSFDPLVDGPPYLRGDKPKVASRRGSTMSNTRSILANIRKSASFTQLVEVWIQDAKPFADLAFCLACIQASASVHQSHHWMSKGSQSYGDHLMYERLYSETDAMVDTLAEKLMGLCHNEGFLDPLTMSQCKCDILKACCPAKGNLTPDDMVQRSLSSVHNSMAFLSQAKEVMTNQNLMTHGLSNMLDDLMDKHQTFLYLLNQRA